jgi:hypothetical protein
VLVAHPLQVSHQLGVRLRQARLKRRHDFGFERGALLLRL